MLTLRGEKSALWSAWKRKDQTFYQCAVECRSIGIHWGNIKRIVQARRKAGEDVTIDRWARQHAPVTKQWLDQFADFAARWPEFIETWRWMKSLPYAPQRRPGLHVFQDLMTEKARYDHTSRTRQSTYGSQPDRIASVNGNSVSKASDATSSPIEALTPTNRLICGDVADALRAHVPDGIADVAIVDPPFWLSRYQRDAVADRRYQMAGMTPRIQEEWDRFGSVAEYEHEAERWLPEVMRCLSPTGSAFILGGYHNIALLCRLCQVMDYFIIAEVIWVRRNSRPNASAKSLQASHFTALWVTKKAANYRFNYQECKRRDYSGDYFAARGMQLRDVWDIPVAAQDKRYHHPSPKPLALYERMLDVAGTPGGLLLEPFAGCAPGAVAAMRWGMESLSIERDESYCEKIRHRVADELSK